MERGEVAPRPEREHGRAGRDAGGDEHADGQHEHERDPSSPVGPGPATANAEHGRGRAPRTAPRTAHAAMVATSRTGFRAPIETPRSVAGAKVAPWAARSQRRGRRSASSCGAGWPSGRSRPGPCSSSRTTSTPREALGQPPPARARSGGRRLGALGQRLVPPDRRVGLRLAVEHAGVLPALSAARRRARARARRSLPAGGPGGVPRGVRRGVRPSPSAGAAASRGGGRASHRALSRALPDVPVPRCGLRGGALPPAGAGDVRARRARAARLGVRRRRPCAPHARPGVALLPALALFAWRSGRRRDLALLAVPVAMFLVYPVTLEAWVGHGLAFVDAQRIWERSPALLGPLGGLVQALGEGDLLGPALAIAMLAPRRPRLAHPRGALRRVRRHGARDPDGVFPSNASVGSIRSRASRSSRSRASPPSPSSAVTGGST